MSAVNVFLYTNCAVVMTDGLAYIADGSYRGIRQKVFPLAHLNGIVAARGPFVFAPTMAATLDARSSFDEAAKHLGEDLKTSSVALGAHMALPDDHAEIYLVGRSEASGEYQGWVTVSKDVPGLDTFQVRSLVTHIAPCVEGADDETKALAHMARTRPLEFDPATHGVALMRGQMGAFPIAVGGLCQLTFVNDTEITTRILERWPDATNKRLNA